MLSAVRNAFGDMLECDTERGGLELRDLDVPLYEVSVVILVTGRAKGLFCISFDGDTALSIVERLLGDRPNRVDEDVLDAMGEMANMITGATKSELNLGMNIGLPKVVRGESEEISFPDESHPMRVHYGSDIGPFCIDFGFVERNL